MRKRLSRLVRRQIFLFGALAIAIIPTLILATSDFKLAITWLAFSLVGFAYARYRESVGQELVVALFFALFVTAYYPYIYSSDNILFGHINIYPLFVWTAGLVLLREIYEHTKSPHHFLLISAIYIAVLFALEYVGFYLLNIQLTGKAPSLWGLGIIHGTDFLHWFYLLAGPVYLVTTDYLNVK